MKLCRFLPIKFFDLRGNINLNENDLIKFFNDYALSKIGLEKDIFLILI